ncbi:MAG: LPS export ABC transporter ATP-binding protein [Planctomycetota bacterium]|nr:LPS export ABC transporter ATP-binding protein [Planctomycetota bacterium]
MPDSATEDQAATVPPAQPAAAPGNQQAGEATVLIPSGEQPTLISAAKPLAPPLDSPFGATDTVPAAPIGEVEPILGGRPRDARAVMPQSSSANLQRLLTTVPSAPPQAVLVSKGLTKRFGKREVVRGVDLQVGTGEVVGLLGRNGAGKTTTFRMIMGQLAPDGGTVIYENRDITHLPMYLRANRGIGYLAQQPSVFQRMTVEDNLMAVLELQEPEKKKRAARVEELIHGLGLDTVRKSMAAVLSGGERRRLEIARAMTLRPRVVLFDEPFSGIDPIAVSEIQQILRELRTSGVGILLTDHNVRETLTITDRTYIMDDGKIWIHGPPREIVQNEEARARYLGQDFRLDF